MEKQKIPEGYKQTEVGVIPEGWDSVSIGELITDLRGGAPFKPSDFTKYGMKVLPKGGVIRGGLLRILEKDQQFCSPSFASKYFKNQVTEKYTIVVLRDLVPSGPSIGLMVKIPDPDNYVLAQGVYGFLTKNQSVSAYLIQYSNTNKYRRAANEIMVGSTQVHITNGAFKELKIALPSTEREQTAIANALSDVDALIAGLEKLIAKKQAIKTATMQQLLTGRTRLPEFANHPDGTSKGYKQTELGEIPEDWDDTLLEEVIEFCSSGATPFRGNKSFYKGDVRWITSGELNYCKIYDPLGKVSLDAVKKSNLRIHPSGTFLMAITGLEAAGTRGSCGIVGLPSTTNQSCMAIYPNKRLDSQYLYHWYVYNGEELAFKYCQGTKQLSYTAGLIKKIPIYLPREIDEQARIANILSDMDEEIQSLQQRLDKTRQIKLGMMQELLTGKTRLVKPEDAA